jgi:hypothetical protein
MRLVHVAPLAGAGNGAAGQRSDPARLAAERASLRLPGPSGLAGGQGRDPRHCASLMPP